MSIMAPALVNLLLPIYKIIIRFRQRDIEIEMEIGMEIEMATGDN
jgi:hypothetical protein